MMLKKYRAVKIISSNKKIIFKRYTKDGDWRCSVDCKIKCIHSDYSYLLGPVCDIMRGMLKSISDDIKYAYYPERDDTEEK